MGSKSDNYENDLLLLVFNNTALAKIGDAAGLPPSIGEGNFYVRLMTDAVTVDDSTLGTEATYTGYVAKGIAVPRNSSNWTVSGSNCSNTLKLSFAISTSGPQTMKFVEVWKDNVSSAIAERLFWAQLDADLIVNSGITPEVPIGDLDINED